MLSLADALNRILTLARPLAPVEVTLTEALGLVLAEPLTGDVDLPPFDRAQYDGHALRASDAAERGARLRVIGSKRSRRSSAKTAEIRLGQGESARVFAGDPLPIGADAVVPMEHGETEPGFGAGDTLVMLRPSEAGQGLVGRGHFLGAGTALAPAGARLRLPMIGLLAAQGCVHPVCHRRVRVAVLGVGDHLVGPGDAPVMHRERNAAAPTVVAPCLHWGATAHDLGVVPERDLKQALDRALTAPVVVVLAAQDGPVPRALKRAGVEPIFEGVAIEPGGRVGYGVVRDSSGHAAHHLFRMIPGPIDVLTGVALLLGPLIARLHGGPSDPPRPLHAVWDGPDRDRSSLTLQTVPVTLTVDLDARLHAKPVCYRGHDDLAGFASAEALALLPPREQVLTRGDVVDVVSL